MRLDLANREAPGVKADDPIVETIEPGAPRRQAGRDRLQARPISKTILATPAVCINR
jgi:hypothetical protein